MAPSRYFPNPARILSNSELKAGLSVEMPSRELVILTNGGELKLEKHPVFPGY
jgi:hypothetical protein